MKRNVQLSIVWVELFEFEYFDLVKCECHTAYRREKGMRLFRVVVVVVVVVVVDNVSNSNIFAFF
jgi:hypothetical protein